MTWYIIKDAERKIAALVADDPPVALGPIAAGDDVDEAAGVLEQFVGLLERPPDEWPTWKLFDEWRNYIDAIVQIADSVAQTAVEDGEELDQVLERAHAGEQPRRDGRTPDEIAVLEAAGYVTDEPDDVRHDLGEEILAASEAVEWPPEPPDPGVDHAADRELEEELEEDDVDDAGEISDRVAAAHAAGHTPAARGEVECWLCHGNREIDGLGGKVRCTTCNGLGVTDADGNPLRTSEEAA